MTPIYDAKYLSLLAGVNNDGRELRLRLAPSAFAAQTL
jgi:hypothetical protein